MGCGIMGCGITGRGITGCGICITGACGKFAWGIPAGIPGIWGKPACGVCGAAPRLGCAAIIRVYSLGSCGAAGGGAEAGMENA